MQNFQLAGFAKQKTKILLFGSAWDIQVEFGKHGK